MAPRVRAAAKERKEARKLPLSFPAASAPLLSQASLGRGRAQTPGHFYFCGEREERTGWGVGRGGKPTSPSQRAAEPRPGCGQEVEEGRKGSRALPIRPRHQGMQLGGRWSEAPWSAVCAVESGPSFTVHPTGRVLPDKAAKPHLDPERRASSPRVPCTQRCTAP